MDTLDKFCHDSEVEVRGKMIPALEYRHPVLYGPDWLLGCWKVLQVEKFRKKKANEDRYKIDVFSANVDDDSLLYAHIHFL